jgi:deoxyribonuclease V
VRLRQLHPWALTPAEAIALQRRLAPEVVREGWPEGVRTVAGVDVAAGRAGERARGAVVVLSYPELRAIQEEWVEVRATFPYVPGLLSFREVPVLAEALQRLGRPPDLLIVDGQGYAHPRRFGLACHLGLLLDVPTIGCAKSRLVGEHAPLGREAGSTSDLVDGGEVVGRVLRTRTGVKPIYVSAGHRIGLDAACEWVVRCCRGQRLPEPVRLADRLSKTGRQLGAW